MAHEYSPNVRGSLAALIALHASPAFDERAQC